MSTTGKVGPRKDLTGADPFDTGRRASASTSSRRSVPAGTIAAAGLALPGLAPLSPRRASRSAIQVSPAKPAHLCIHWNNPATCVCELHRNLSSSCGQRGTGISRALLSFCITARCRLPRHPDELPALRLHPVCGVLTCEYSVRIRCLPLLGTRRHVPSAAPGRFCACAGSIEREEEGEVRGQHGQGGTVGGQDPRGAAAGGCRCLELAAQGQTRQEVCLLQHLVEKKKNNRLAWRSLLGGRRHLSSEARPFNRQHHGRRNRDCHVSIYTCLLSRCPYPANPPLPCRGRHM